eukprot:g26864.t1
MWQHGVSVISTAASQRQGNLVRSQPRDVGGKGVPSDFTCEKCTQIQLLTDRFRELEVDELRIIREAEGVIERSYKEVVTPKAQDKGSWVTVRMGKGNRLTVQGSPVAVLLN